MALRRLILVLTVCLLTACAAGQQAANDTPQVQSTQNKEPESSDLRKSIKDRYDKAADVWVDKLIPITEEIAKVCRQKNDKAYISCLDKKNDQLIASSFFPDLVSNMLSARKELDKKLITNKITRKDYLENASKLQEKLRDDVNERMAHDIKSGVYTGKY